MSQGPPLSTRTDDSKPLLDEDEESVTVTSKPQRPIKQPKCKFVIEPVLLLSATFGFPRIILDPLFLYYKVALDLNGGNESAFNISDLSAPGGCNDNSTNSTNPFYQDVQEHSADMFIYRGIATAVPSFFVALFLGSYSDKVGRKYALTIPLVFESLSVALVLCIILFRLPTWTLYVVSFIEGCGGSYQTVLLAVFAYLADTVAPKERAFRITVVEMMMFATGILSFVGIGYWVNSMGFLWPYVLVFGGKVLVVLIVVFLVPETITPDPNASFFDTDNIKATAVMIRSRSHPGRCWKLVLLLVTFFLPTMVVLGERVDTLFEMARPVCFGPVQIGQFGAAYITVTAVGGVVGAKVLKFCLPDIALAIIAASSAIVMDIYKAFVQSALMMWFVPAFSLFTGFFIPTLRAIMSNLVEPHEQGSLFGSVACIEVLCSLAGVTIFNAIYSATFEWYHGFVFLVNCLFYGSGVILLIIYHFASQRESKREEIMKEVD